MPSKNLTQPIRYRLPDTSVFSKYFNWNTEFADQDWSDWGGVVRGFRSRISDWYFTPLSAYPVTGHEAYPVLCTMCALVEAFAHYHFRVRHGTKKRYTKFLPVLDPVFSTKLSNPIITTQPSGSLWRKTELTDFSEVFYAGVRCSLHHHGDLEPFAGMSGTGVLALERPNVGQSVCGKYRYSIVVFDPWVLRESLEHWFEEFCSDLESDPEGQRARTFRERFAEDFAITIPEPSP